MITKLTIMCLSITASSMLGLAHMKSKKARVTYFASLVKLIDTLISEISFRKENLFEILKDFSKSENGELGKQIENFCLSPYEKPDIKGKLLKPEEKRIISEFFYSLGTTDSQTQLLELENHRAAFSKIYEEENEKFKKTGAIGLKLAVLLGLAIGILIL